MAQMEGQPKTTGTAGALGTSLTNTSLCCRPSSALYSPCAAHCFPTGEPKRRHAAPLPGPGPSCCRLPCAFYGGPCAYNAAGASGSVYMEFIQLRERRHSLCAPPRPPHHQSSPRSGLIPKRHPSCPLMYQECCCTTHNTTLSSRRAVYLGLSQRVQQAWLRANTATETNSHSDRLLSCRQHNQSALLPSITAAC